MSPVIFSSAVILSYMILIPLALKWGLGRKVAIWAPAFIGIFAGAITYSTMQWFELGVYSTLLLQHIVILIIAMSAVLLRFYRDPQRIPTSDPTAILSPADGKIIYIAPFHEGEPPVSRKRGVQVPLADWVQCDIFKSRGYIIGIAMNFLDVHVNRSPVGGKIGILKHIKGKYLSLRKEEAICQNERLFTLIDNSAYRVGVVQIASRLVRQIVPFVREGDVVRAGMKLGMIRFGSQVDVILPHNPSVALSIFVQPGDKVLAGISVIAKITSVIPS